jgi:hypothetical protein
MILKQRLGERSKFHRPSGKVEPVPQAGIIGFRAAIDKTKGPLPYSSGVCVTRGILRANVFEDAGGPFLSGRGNGRAGSDRRVQAAVNSM